jgi:hypothetical protein
MVSQALQLSMRVQQQVTELAIKGDDALSTLRPAEEAPEWATFDEDSPETNGSVRLSPFDTVDGDFDVATDDEPVPAGDPWSAEERAMLHELDNAAPAEVPEPEPVEETVDAGPAAMPDYASLSLPQVRARMVRLSVRQLNQVLAFERAHEDRQSFVNMLTRRVATLRSQQ